MALEKRPDMFDVACGECELVDFLLTRFDPIDLKTKIKFDAMAQVDEQLASAPKEEEPETPLIPERPKAEPMPIQLNLKMPPPPGSPPAEANDPNDGYRPAAAVAPAADGQDVLETTEETPPEPEAPAPGSQDWLALYHQRFQEAAQRYQEEVAPEKPADETG